MFSDPQLLLGLLVTLLPVLELRVGLPIVIGYSLENNLSVWPYALLVIMLNIGVIYFIFLFLDYLHGSFLRIPVYKKIVGRLIERMQKRIDKTKKGIDAFGFIALTALVAVPLPGTGAWSGTLIAWVLGAERMKSFIAIAAGVVIAGILVLLASLSLFSLFGS